MEEDPTIRSEAGFMLHLVEEVRRGRAVPARFQRPFVWTRGDVIALWTSILRGYPLGTFLMWRPKDAAVQGRTTLGPIPIDPSPRSSLILDGQNRLVTLAWSMTPPDADVPDDAPGRHLFRSGETLVLDPASRSARFVADDAVDGMIMPVHLLFEGMSAFFRRAWRSDADDAAMAWLDHAGSRLRETRIVTTTIEDATPEQAKEAFLHIARAGVPMSDDDFDRAVGNRPDE